MMTEVYWSPGMKVSSAEKKGKKGKKKKKLENLCDRKENKDVHSRP